MTTGAYWCVALLCDVTALIPNGHQSTAPEGA